MAPCGKRVAQNQQPNFSRPGKRRFEEVNNSIESLKQELWHYDYILKTELEQRVFCDYDRALLEAELYKERLEALTMSSKAQVGLVQIGATLLAWDRQADNSIGYNDGWNSKRKKLNHGEDYYYNNNTQSYCNYSNNSYNQAIYYNNAYNQDNNWHGSVNQWTSYSYQNTINNRYYAPKWPNYNRRKNCKAATNNVKASTNTGNSKSTPGSNQANNAVQTSFSTTLNLNAFKTTPAGKPTALTATTTSTVKPAATAVNTVTSAVKPTAAVTAVPTKPSTTQVTTAAAKVNVPVKTSSIPVKTIPNTVASNPVTSSNSTSVINGNTKTAKPTSIPNKVVASRSISYEDAVKFFTAKSKLNNTIDKVPLSNVKKNYTIIEPNKPKTVQKDRVPHPKVLLKNESGAQNNNEPTLFSLNLSPIMKLRFAESDRISFKTEKSPVCVNLFPKFCGIKNEPINADSMEDDLADHI